MVYVDTNILARFLVGDSPELFEKAKKLFGEAQAGKVSLYFDEVMLSETIWLLTKFYKRNKVDVISALEELVGQNFVVNPRKKIILKALGVCRVSNLSFVDCWLAELSKEEKLELKTFDKKLKKKMG